MKKTSDALEIIDHMIGDDQALRDTIARERENLEIASLIYDARTAARLSQHQLAEKVGTSQSTIARLEDANYGGHSLNMLRRIAQALHLRLDVKLVRVQDDWYQLKSQEPMAPVVKFPRNDTYQKVYGKIAFGTSAKPSRTLYSEAA